MPLIGEEYLKQFWAEIADLAPEQQYEAIIGRREELTPHCNVAQNFRDRGDEFMVVYELILAVAPDFDSYDPLQQHHLVVSGRKSRTE